MFTLMDKMTISELLRYDIPNPLIFKSFRSAKCKGGFVFEAFDFGKISNLALGKSYPYRGVGK